MSLFSFVSILVVIFWLIQNLLLVPILAIDAFHLSGWLVLGAGVLGFAWLAAE